MPKRRPCREFVLIGSVLGNVLRQCRPAMDDSLLKIWDVWEKAVGSAVAVYARPAAFKDRILLVHVSNSTWLHHLRFQQEDMLGKLNDKLGGRALTAIKFKIGPV